MAKFLLKCTLVTVLTTQLILASTIERRDVRQVANYDGSNIVDPIYQESDFDLSENNREKRKIGQFQQAKDGIKSAVLGLVFGKINSFIDKKTKLITQLDQTNIYKNKELGIEAPKDFAFTGITSALSSVIGPKLQLLGPKISFITQKIGSLSSFASGASSGGAGGDAGAHASFGAGFDGGADFSAGGSVDLGAGTGYGGPKIGAGVAAGLFGGQQTYN